MPAARVHWICPGCGRTYAIPVGHSPSLCPQCAAAPPVPPTPPPVPWHSDRRLLIRAGVITTLCFAALALAGIVMVRDPMAGPIDPVEWPLIVLGSVTLGAVGVALAVFYVTPLAIAFYRQHPNFPAIAALNLILGWSLLGWVASLVWALTQPIQRQPHIHFHTHQQGP